MVNLMRVKKKMRMYRCLLDSTVFFFHDVRFVILFFFIFELFLTVMHAICFLFMKQQRKMPSFLRVSMMMICLSSLAFSCGSQHALVMLAGLVTPIHPLGFSAELGCSYMISASLVHCGAHTFRWLFVGVLTILLDKVSLSVVSQFTFFDLCKRKKRKKATKRQS